MRQYQVIVKMNALYGKEGAGYVDVVKEDASNASTAAARAIKAFLKRTRARVGVGNRVIKLEITRVL